MVKRSDRLTVLMRDHVIRAYRSKTQVAFHRDKAIVSEFVNLNALAYLRKARKVSNRIELSQTSARVEEYASKLEIDLGDLRKRIWKPSTKGLQRHSGPVRDALNKALKEVAGKSETEAVKEINERLRKMGVYPRHAGYVETLVRTHSAIAYSAAQQAQYMSDPMVWGFEYVTMDDGRVRDEHELKHGMRRPQDDPIWDYWWPPNGWNCRCRVVPLYGEHQKSKVYGAKQPEPEFAFSPLKVFQGKEVPAVVKVVQPKPEPKPEPKKQTIEGDEQED